jgi:lysine-specific permease
VDWYGLVVAYIGLPFAIALWLIHKFVTKTKPIPYDRINLTGGDDLDIEERA